MATALELVREGIQMLASDPHYKERHSYATGAPFHTPILPPGLKAYGDLARIAGSPLIKVAISTVTRRLRTAGLHTEIDGPPDKELTRVLEANRWASRQALVWEQALTHGHGIVSVWPNPEDPTTPVINVEDPARVAIKMDPSDPFRIQWVVKLRTLEEPSETSPGVDMAYLYTDAQVRKFVSKRGVDVWTQVATEPNPLQRIPFVIFATERHPDGSVECYITPLIPIVRAIDTIRVDLLLAAQFAAYRQKVATGFDPIIRDSNGEPIWQSHVGSYAAVWDTEGHSFVRGHSGNPVQWDSTSPDYVGPRYESRVYSGEILDIDATTNNPIPRIQAPEAGVDRLLVFPGADTNVTDFAESNLQNYTTAIDHWLNSFAAASHVPSQYLAIGDWKNVSGETVEANESGLRVFINSIQVTLGDSVKDMADLIHRATATDDETIPPRVLDVSWRNMEPRSLSQVGSAASQMVPNGAPLRMFLEMLASSPYEVDRWISQADEEKSKASTRLMMGDVASLVSGPKPPVPSLSEMTNPQPTTPPEDSPAE